MVLITRMLEVKKARAIRADIRIATRVLEWGADVVNESLDFPLGPRVCGGMLTMVRDRERGDNVCVVNLYLEFAGQLDYVN
jgi:hypothetical protein